MHSVEQPETSREVNPLRKLRDTLGLDLTSMATAMGCNYHIWWRAENAGGLVPKAAHDGLRDIGVDPNALQAELNAWRAREGAALREELRERLHSDNRASA